MFRQKAAGYNDHWFCRIHRKIGVDIIFPQEQYRALLDAECLPVHKLYAVSLRYIADFTVSMGMRFAVKPSDILSKLDVSTRYAAAIPADLFKTVSNRCSTPPYPPIELRQSRRFFTQNGSVGLFGDRMSHKPPPGCVCAFRLDTGLESRTAAYHAHVLHRASR